MDIFGDMISANDFYTQRNLRKIKGYLTWRRDDKLTKRCVECYLSNMDWEEITLETEIIDRIQKVIDFEDRNEVAFDINSKIRSGKPRHSYGRLVENKEELECLLRTSMIHFSDIERNTDMRHPDLYSHNDEDDVEDEDKDYNLTPKKEPKRLINSNKVIEDLITSEYEPLQIVISIPENHKLTVGFNGDKQYTEYIIKVYTLNCNSEKGYDKVGEKRLTTKRDIKLVLYTFEGDSIFIPFKFGKEYQIKVYGVAEIEQFNEDIEENEMYEVRTSLYKRVYVYKKLDKQLKLNKSRIEELEMLSKLPCCVNCAEIMNEYITILRKYTNERGRGHLNKY